MAAEIKPVPSLATSSNTSARGNQKKPILLHKIEGYDDDVNQAILLPGEDGVIAVCDDRSVRVWLKRDSGQFWPSICHYLPSGATSVCYTKESRKIFVGQENGTVSEFILAEDYNSVLQKRDYLSHHARVTQVHHEATPAWVLSVGRDKWFQYYCANTGKRLGGHICQSWVLCLEFDFASRHVFIGDASGQITMLKLDPQPDLATNHTTTEQQPVGVHQITVFKGHSASVRSLSWDAPNKFLFSGSEDKGIIVWDIGGQKGTAYELQGHKDKVTSVAFSPSGSKLVSGGEDSMLWIWNMKAKRTETSEWTESSTCQRCSRPFFWNLRGMFDQRQIGLRQHHCRQCGRAVCDDCSPHRSVLPAIGFEYEVRVCIECNKKLTDSDRVSLAVCQEAKHSILWLHLDEERGRLLTLGHDRVMKIWDVSALLRSAI